MKSILEFINELRYFREMAYTRNKAIETMTSASRPLNQHLLKLLVFGWNTDWAKTVFDIASDINDIRLKPSNKRLSEALIKEYLLESDITNIAELKSKLPAFIKNYETEYSVPVKRRDINEIAKKYDELKSFLIRRIAQDEGLLRSTVYNKIRSVVEGENYGKRKN